MLVSNASGRIMELSESDYNRLSKMGLKFNVISQKDEDKKTKAKIGVFLQRILTGEQHCASDRIRGEWVIDNSPDMEIWRPNRDYEAIIFHIPCKDIADYNCIKILDICDDVWRLYYNFKELIATVDAITVPTEGLKEALSKVVTDKDIYVIPDGHNFKHYETRKENKHTEKAKSVAWFGYAKNFHPVVPLLDEIKKQGLKLKVVSQLPVGVGEYVKWDVNTYIREISECDFAILPKNGNLKSDNKTITALLSGIPVAKDAEDIKRLINPDERRRDLKEAKKFLPSYSSELRTKQYLNLIEKIRAKKPVLYTAINGGYEKPRNDIKIYTDRPDDKFKQPVMNAKIYKVLPHKFFKTKYSVWIDGNIFPLVDAEKYIELLGDCDIAIFKHPYRKCIYEEAPEAQKRVSEENKGLIDSQMNDYRSEGMPENFGLYECGMIIRKHTKIVEEFNNRWWTEITRYSQRDQLSFPYVLWKMKGKIKVKIIDGNVRSHKYFNYVAHNC